MTTSFSSFSYWSCARHPAWYFYDADCFLSHGNFIFGLHRRIFNQSARFERIFTQRHPTHGFFIGTTHSFPIIVDQVPLLTFMGFLTLAYYPNFYNESQTELEQLHQLCVNWKFPHLSQIVVRKLIELRQTQLPIT